jgi:hypothetical protein
MAEYKATPEQWALIQDCADDFSPESCILELRARVEALEAAAHKHIVETNSNIVALFTRVESLEAAERQASKVYEINEPLQLTPEQAQQINDLLAPNSKPTPNPSQMRSSLVERVAKAISQAPWPDPALDTSNTHEGWRSEARAAIREVAHWIDAEARQRQLYPHNGVYSAAEWLEQEAER